ncbi:MAG: acyl-CoA synthetase FdrA [Enterococcaceae bacterium]|jgi:succinyl-CoA synthetase alpha subunit|nr:acyl-CoA synthetase FdrA [Enterococcaceae bacterium]MCI1918816.1 acyl-CoA synthetase FdrA [Enterococcaceae bacterium]
MLKTVILKNNYQDSINLMLLTNKINDLKDVQMSQIMMGTDANKDILNNTHLLTAEAKAASPNDLMIVVDSDQNDIMDEVLPAVHDFLDDLSAGTDNQKETAATSWDEALAALPDANMALFSIPGEYGAPEMEKALKKNLHVFSFTDNVSLDDEVRLKKLAHEKGLLMMGPDCGTGIISSIPIAFTNVVSPGNIGVVGASGTGIQEVTTIIDRLGGGVIHAIGTGGRDLSDKVGAITVKDAIVALENHEPTDVICVISKPPAKEVRDEVVELLQSVSKPVVAIFLGEKPENHEGKVFLAHTLEETAKIAIDLANDRPVKPNYFEKVTLPDLPVLAENKEIKGLYSGGTLAAEAGMLISEALHLDGLVKEDGFILKSHGYDVIDLGDDIYTQGKPHPMIDPEVRIKMIHDYASQPNTGVILFDVVLGYGAHPDMAGALLPAIKEEQARAEKEGRKLYFVATVVGTEKDPQNYDEAVKKLKDNGVYVLQSNAKAVQFALDLKGIQLSEKDKKVLPYTGKTIEVPAVSDKVMELLNTKPRIINVGVQSFNDSIRDFGGKSEQFNWKPRANGNKKMIKILDALDDYSDMIDQENQKVIDKIKQAQPFLIDVVPAKSVIPELNETKKTLLHAGPPITYDQMTGPMQGSCVGAALFEGWAKNEDEARRLLESGEVRFIPCHHVHAVGPMGGITSANMPVVVVENRLDGTRAYCTMNEGIGKVLRFGAYSKEVIDRLNWMKDILGPTIAQALKKTEDGLNLNVLIARSITMGDEFHQRNIAASLNFLKEMAPLITELSIAEQQKYDVIKFLADTDQFFLNIMMATGKSIVDAARKDAKGTIVTTMTRNGVNFGVRSAQAGDKWFEAPVNTPVGLYFTGFSEKDGNPDIGDSSITETVGVGAMAMIAAPGVTRFVGAGGFQDALDISNEMEKICVTHNPNWTIPTWDFKGTNLGIDIRKVVETGITPLINTGIANKKAGVGQVGAGTVRAPLGCFEKALEDYAKELGINVD